MHCWPTAAPYIHAPLIPYETTTMNMGLLLLQSRATKSDSRAEIIVPFSFFKGEMKAKHFHVGEVYLCVSS